MTFRLLPLLFIILTASIAWTSPALAGNVAYIYGGTTESGDLTSSDASAYHRMRLFDTGSTGLSLFKQQTEERHNLTEYYDQTTNLTSLFLNQFDVVIFGLHQKIWSSQEKAALDTWLKAGGGMMIYSDSASGGKYNAEGVGPQNPVGQGVTNNLLTDYGMQVTVDQAHGVRTQTSNNNHPIVSGQVTLEGEGVSPVAVDTNNPNIEILIPYPQNDLNHLQGITLNNPSYAALALANVAQGHILAMFDRQPIWNSGPGSSIQEKNNALILKRAIDFLAVRSQDPVNPTLVSPGVLFLLFAD